MAIWVITGASSGIGAGIADAALQAGHCVVGTSRDVARVDADLIQHERFKWFQLDVAADDAEEKLKAAIHKFVGGKVDVLVNCAGRYSFGSVEDSSIEEIHKTFNTNFLSAIRTTKACIPLMRAASSGTIVFISSTQAIIGMPGCAGYAASKAAMSSLAEVLAGELGPFGIRVVDAVMGVVATGFIASPEVPGKGVSPAYEEVIGRMLESARVLGKNPGMVPGDPGKIGERIVELVDGNAMTEGVPGLAGVRRLLLGKDAVISVKRMILGLGRGVEATEGIAASVEQEGLREEEVEWFRERYPWPWDEERERKMIE